MNGMSMGAAQQRIDQQAGINRERWLQKTTGRRAVLVLEVAGTCRLEGMDGHDFYVKREELENKEVWERLV